MVGMANRALQDFRKFFPWGALIKTVSLPLQAGVLEYDLPVDFDEYRSESMWQQDSARPANMPTDNFTWALLKSGNPGVSVTYYARLQYPKIVFAQVPIDDVINYEYQSSYAVMGADAIAKQRFTADNDRPLLDDEVVALGTKAYWKLEKEIKSGDLDYRDFKQQMRHAIAKDAGPKAVRYPEGTTFYSPPIADTY
jgi:hypothetical protein